MNKEKRKVGRPRFEVTPEVCEQVENLAAQGLTVDQIALVLGVHKATLFDKQNEYSDFSDAIKRGRGKGIANVTNALYEKATVDKDNTAMIFYLKNRDEVRWKDRVETTTNHSINLNTVLSSAKKRLIDVTPELKRLEKDE